MKGRHEHAWVVAALVALSCGDVALGAPLQVVSSRDAMQAAVAGGSGDSAAPIFNADGRYVLFASTANNLSTNPAPMPVNIPANLNVYLRDRQEGLTRLVSVNSSGLGGGNGDSLPCAISSDGRYACFESSATDLVAGDTNNATDIFVRDLVAGSTVLVSVSTNGFAGNGASRTGVMTPDGRYVAFVSAANNLVPGDSNRIPDVFVRDLQAGTTAWASVGAVSALGTGSSEAPDITPDGRYVAFFSTATNLVSGVPAGGDVYVRDLSNGTTVWASAGARTATLAVLKTSSAASYNHALSGDGQFVAYEASSTASPGPSRPGVVLRYNMASGLTDVVHTNAAVPGCAYQDAASVQISADGRFVAFVANTNNTATTCVELWDGLSGTAALVSAGLNGLVPANSTCDWPTLDPSGQFVAFVSTANNLTTNVVAAGLHIYVRDMQGGTVLVDADAAGRGAVFGGGTVPSMTADGRLVAFESLDSTLVDNDRNHDLDVFARDLLTGTMEMISAPAPELPAASANGSSTFAGSPLSADGRYVVFVSDADNLVAGDTNGCADIFLRDLATGQTVLVSAGTNGTSADAVSNEASLSADGRFVAFTSRADDLVPGDNNNARDVFFRDLVTGATTLVSFKWTGPSPGSKASYAPLLSPDGRFVLFRSQATDLAPGTFTGENLFLRDMQTGVIAALTTNGIGALAPELSVRDQVLYLTSGTNPKLYVWDGTAGRAIYTNSTLSVLDATFSGDGNRIAISTKSGTPLSNAVAVVELATGSKVVVESNTTNSAYLQLCLDGSGQSLACIKAASLPGVTNQLYLFDVLSGGAQLASHALNSAQGGYGRADSPAISADGRFLAYRSAAENLVAGDTNGLPDLFLYDRITGSNTLLSASSATGQSGNNRSLRPVFAADGETLLFQSWASDLAPLDYNHASDLFGYVLLYARVWPAANPAEGPWLSWPSVPGQNYRVEFKDSLDAGAWGDLGGSFTNLGNKAWLQDPAPAAAKRFYRVLSF